QQVCGILRLGPRGAVEHRGIAGAVGERAGQAVRDPEAQVGVQRAEYAHRGGMARGPMHQPRAPVLLGQEGALTYRWTAAVDRGVDCGWDLCQMGVGDDEHAGGHGPKLGAALERRKRRCCILRDVITTITLRVNYSETDQMEVVYHANYLIWFDRARTELMRETGVTYKELEQQGVYLAVSEVKVRYRAAARYDDLVRVRCWG